MNKDKITYPTICFFDWLDFLKGTLVLKMNDANKSKTITS